MILLSRAYAGYPAGSIAQFQTALESVLVSAGYGTASAGPVTPGAVTTTQTTGRVGIAAGASTVVVTNPLFTTETKFLAYLSNGTADGTATAVIRATPANGSVTFAVNANATAAIAIDWVMVMISGENPTV